MDKKTSDQIEKFEGIIQQREREMRCEGQAARNHYLAKGIVCLMSFGFGVLIGAFIF